MELEVPLDASPEQVWEAISTAAGMTAWFAPGDPAPDENGESSDGEVVRWEPGRGYKVVAGTSSYEYLIKARDGGGSAVLRYIQTGFEGDDWEAEYKATTWGWGLYFHTLSLYLSDFVGRPATYVRAEGPEWSNTPEAWQKLRDTLGVVAEGKKIRLDVPGLGPVVGVLDYLGPSHLGIRTDEALLRFHCRDLLGMPVALGHHYYGDKDQQRLQSAWQTWLTSLYE